MSATIEPAIEDAAAAIRREVGRVVVGQQEVIEQLLVALLTSQHCLLEANTGSAKNLLAASLAQALGLDFYRIHCTQELSPAELLTQASQSTTPAPNVQTEAAALPHVWLVDDITRLTPATRVVMQQAIQEGVVQVDGQRYSTPTPFLVLATKYRRDDESADVAEEPRADRYMLKIAVRFPSYHDEFQVGDRVEVSSPNDIRPVLTAARIEQFQQQAAQVVAPAHVVHYALRLVRSTRVHEGQTPDFAFEWIGTGAGPRATHHLLTAARMRAAWDGRDFAGIEDVQAMIHSVLRHRLVTNENARANGITPDRVIDRLVYEIPVRIDGDDAPASLGEAPKFDLTSDDPWSGEE